MEQSPYFRADFPAAAFAARRRSIFEKIGTTVAMLRGNPATGAFDLFRQNNDFYYLTGVEVPVSYLLLDGRTRTSTFYLPARDAKHERSEGRQFSSEDGPLIHRLTGIENVRSLEQFPRDLIGAAVVYLPFEPAEGKQACRDTLRYGNAANAADPLGSIPPEKLLRDRIGTLGSQAEIRNLSPILDGLRLIKDEHELSLMRRAGKLAALGVVEAMRGTRPGVMEYQLAATAEYVYLVNGASGSGYRPIVAGGANIWNAHYYRNNAPLREGDLVLMDGAPDVGNYTSDIGRLWPVNGRYSAQQRELYGFVVEFHKRLLGRIRPGLTPAQIITATAGEVQPLFESWAFSKPVYREACRKLLTFAGSLSHPVGMAVHDVGIYSDAPLVPGLTFAVDPQIWVPEEELYIRVEDTVAVTRDGIENLTALAPLDLDEVEKVMQEPGLLQFRPPIDL